MPFRICVIDDDDLFREALAADLRREGFEVFESGKGAEGVELVLETNAHIAIVDIFLPDIGGAYLLALIREAAPRTGRIAISGADPQSGDWFVDALSAANAFAPKPINVKRLCGQIRMVLRGD